MTAEIKPYLNLILCSAFSLLLGIFFSHKTKTCTQLARDDGLSSISQSFTQESTGSVQVSNSDLDELTAMASDKFSCNPRSAFERLTRLHKNRVKMDEHRKRGDANRDRIATITRKAIAADAEENSFRNCVKLVLPELLDHWDLKAAKGQLSVGWDEDSENKNAGITVAELEAAADELEGSL